MIILNPKPNLRVVYNSLGQLEHAANPQTGDKYKIELSMEGSYFNLERRQGVYFRVIDLDVFLPYRLWITVGNPNEVLEQTLGVDADFNPA